MHKLEVRIGILVSRATELVRISDQAEEGAVMRPAKVTSCMLSIVGVCARYPGVSEIDSQKPISRYKSGLAERIADLPSNEPDAWQKSITN